MKVKLLSSAKSTADRECKHDIRKHSRNLRPEIHPLQRPREYQRAVVAAKLSRMFAHPLVAGKNMEHRDSITATAISRRSLAPLLAGSSDGAVKLWDLQSRTAVWDNPSAHTRTVTGVCFDRDGQSFYSCADDGCMHRWSRNTTNESDAIQPQHSWRIHGVLKDIDHHWSSSTTIATASDTAVHIWDCNRTTPIATLDSKGVHTITTVRYHPVEEHVLGYCAADRGIGLTDTRTSTAIRRTVLQMQSNDLQWNPMEPMVLAVANEDGNAYSFDMRHLDRPLRIHKGHVGAVMSLAWAPSGREFVTGSYDRTVRIFPATNNTAREIYHGQRMQRVGCVAYTFDHQFCITGSDDGNLRVWKTVAHAQLEQKTPREEAAMRYRSALVKKFQHVPEVRGISKARRIPRAIKNQTAQATVQTQSQRRKEDNRIKHGQGTFKPQRDRVVVREEE